VSAPRTSLRIILTSFRGFFDERCPEAAAGIGFYAVFAMFPFLLLLVAVSSLLLESPDTQERVLSAVLRFLPVSGEIVTQNMTNLMDSRATAGVVSAVGLLWAATGVFTTVVRNVDRAWRGEVAMNVLLSRLVAVVIVFGLVGLAALLLLARSFICVPVGWAPPGPLADALAGACGLPSRVAISGFIFLTLTLLYQLVPGTRVRWREAALGAAVGVLAFRAVTAGFTWYLDSGLARYNVVYGSLGALVALLSWIYVVAAIILYGAHLSAATAAHTRGLPVRIRGPYEDQGSKPDGNRAKAKTIEPDPE